MDEVRIMNTIHLYIMARITNLFDANELTEMYAQKLSRMAAYATAEDYLGKDAPEEYKKSYLEQASKHAERRRQYAREYYQKHKAERNEYSKKYYREHKEQKKEYDKNHRTKLKEEGKLKKGR